MKSKLSSVLAIVFLLLLAPMMAAQESDSPLPVIITIPQGEKKEISLGGILSDVQSQSTKASISGIDFASFDETKEKLIVDATLIQPVGTYFGKLVLDSKEIPLVIAVSEDNPPLNVKVILKDNFIETGENLRLYFDIKTLTQIKNTSIQVNYEITDFYGNILATHTNEKTFSPSDPVFDTLQVPSSIQPGKYILIAKVIQEGSMVVTAELFEVGEKELLPSRTVTRIALIALIGVGIAVFLLLIALFLLRKNIDFIVKNQPKKLEEIYASYIKTRKASDAVSKLRKQLGLLNSGRRLRVIDKGLHEKASRRIYSVVRKIEHKYKNVPIGSKDREETDRLKRELSLIESAYKLKSIKKGHYKEAKKRILGSLKKRQ